MRLSDIALNLLTPDVVLEASREIQAGITVQMDLRLDHFESRVAGREPFKHQIIDFREGKAGTSYEICAHDDVLTFNTQSSSQWDGLRHVGLQESSIYYEGVRHRDIDEKRDDGQLGTHRECVALDLLSIPLFLVSSYPIPRLLLARRSSYFSYRVVRLG